MENGQNTQTQKKNMWIIVAIIVLLLAVIAVMGAMLFRSMMQGEAPGAGNAASGSTPGALGYETNVITSDPKTLQDAVDRMYEKAAEGQMALEMQLEASSEDGKTFHCYLANSADNRYDMFMILSLDSTQQEIYRTGLIPVGGRIESFTLDQKLQSGTYTATLVYVQVEADKATEHARVNVGLTLVVQ